MARLLASTQRTTTQSLSSSCKNGCCDHPDIFPLPKRMNARGFERWPLLFMRGRGARFFPNKQKWTPCWYVCSPYRRTSADSFSGTRVRSVYNERSVFGSSDTQGTLYGAR